MNSNLIKTAPRKSLGTDFHNTKQYYSKFLQPPGSSISAAQYKRIITKFNLALRDKIVASGFEWSIFYQFGKLAVYKYKPVIKTGKHGRPTLPINARATHDLWEAHPEYRKKKYVYHMNNHTNGYLCKIFYTKVHTASPFKNLQLTQFLPCYRFKNSVWRAIIKDNGIENYFTFDLFNAK